MRLSEGWRQRWQRQLVSFPQLFQNKIWLELCHKIQLLHFWLFDHELLTIFTNSNLATVLLAYTLSMQLRATHTNQSTSASNKWKNNAEEVERKTWNVSGHQYHFIFYSSNDLWQWMLQKADNKQEQFVELNEKKICMH